jgi:hypothetical protein
MHASSDAIAARGGFRMRKTATVTWPKASYSIQDVVVLANTCRDNVYRDIHEGRLRARQNGRRTVVLHDDFVAYLEAFPELDLDDQSRRPPSRRLGTKVAKGKTKSVDQITAEGAAPGRRHERAEQAQQQVSGG